MNIREFDYLIGRLLALLPSYAGAQLDWPIEISDEDWPAFKDFIIGLIPPGWTHAREILDTLASFEKNGFKNDFANFPN